LFQLPPNIHNSEEKLEQIVIACGMDLSMFLSQAQKMVEPKKVLD
jgi:hypothetical protein